MNNAFKVALAAAVVVVAVVALDLLPGGGGPGGGGTETSPSTAPSSGPADVFPPSGDLALGSHPLTVDGVPLSFVVPAGWYSNFRPFIDKRGDVPLEEGGSLVFWSPNNSYAEPCAAASLNPPVGPSTEDLAEAMSTLPGTKLVSAPSDVTVGGHPAKRVVFTVPEDVGCLANEFYLASSETPDDACGGTETCGRHASALGDTIRMWIVDVDGKRIVIEGETRKDAGPELEQEIQQIVDSIQFE